MDPKGTSETDPVSGVTYFCLSLAVRYFFPEDEFLSEELTGTVLNTRGHLFSGSWVDRLGLPVLSRRMKEQLVHDNEEDTMYTHETLDSLIQSVQGRAEVQDQMKTNKPGYCYLKFENFTAKSSDLFVSVHGNMYFTNTKVKSFNAQLHKMKSKNYQGEYGNHNADVVQSLNDREYKWIKCISIPWPLYAFEWVNRRRLHGWPSSNLIDKVVAAGCQLVAESHPLSTCPEIDWRYTFPLAEVALAHSLNDMQRITYKVFKALVKYYAKTSALYIPSHLLKNILFWVCEIWSSTDWDTDKLGFMFLVLLDTLIEFLNKHNVPNYFIPQNNLISGLSYGKVETWITCVRYVRQNSLQCMEEFHSEWTTVRIKKVLPFNLVHGCNILKMIAYNSKYTFEAKKHFATLSLEMFGVYFGSEGYHEMVLSLAKTTIDRCIDPGEEESIRLDEMAIGKVSEDLMLLKRQYLKHIEQVTSDTPYSGLLTCSPFKADKGIVLASLMAEVACICYQMAADTNLECFQRTELCKDAEKYFRLALCCHKCPLDVRLKYAEHLVIIGKYCEAIEILKKLVTVQKPADFYRVYHIRHGKYTDRSVENTIRIREISEKGSVILDIQNLTYYLMLICCKELGKKPGEYGIPGLFDYYQGWKEIFPETDLVELQYLEGCFLLRYGEVQKALYVFSLTGENYWYKWFCVAILFCKYLRQFLVS